jgi:hypothetical protein
MSEVGESKTFKRFPMTIAEMGPWDFQAAVDSLGLTEDDQAAVTTGDATLEQVARLQVVGQMAKHSLINAEAGQPFGKPS